MNAHGPIVGLQLESRPQTLTIVRGMLSGVAELLEMDPELLDDLKTTVSEACNNVVLHAYGERPGPMEIRVYADDSEVCVEVDDAGVGFDGTPTAAAGVTAIGVSVIRALASRASFAVRPDGGTEVSITFEAEREGRRLFAAPVAAAAADAPFAPLHGEELGLSLSPVRLLTGVLGRLARTLAAGAHFSLDRFSDVYLITDTLAAHAAQAAVGGRIFARLWATDHRLELVLGPFGAGTGTALTALDADRLSSPLALLADEVTVMAVDGEEAVRVVMLDARR